ncbi:MAG: PilN domain-containing protein [Candidatus Schekmanbacteria bacterium]|nr:PilN domain-containing protein [Candidatus Schekmanbacteria bacterium]
MIKINLLPIEREIKQARATIELSIYLATVFVLVILLFILNVVRQSTLSSLTAEVENLTQKVNSMKDVEALHTSIQDEKAKLTTKLDSVLMVTESETTFIKHLDELSLLIPGGIWLDTLDFTGTSYSFGCNAASYYDVSQFYNKVKESSLFTIGPFPSIAEAGTEAGRPTYKFKISGTTKDLKIHRTQAEVNAQPQGAPSQSVPQQVPGNETQQKKG